MNTLEVKKTNSQPARRMVGIQADSSSNLPTRVQLIRAGAWRDSIKGDLEITIMDLLEYKANFDRGLAQTQDQNGNFIGLPVDFSHEDWKGAAFWIKAVEVEGDILYASQVEYTTPGIEALTSGEYKCFSPSFYPACLGQWYDPEDPTITARNVLVGGGLTNIPFFKGLTAIMASQASQEDREKNVIYVSASTKGEIMDLAQVLAKKKDELSTEEQAFLVEHKSELTADQQIAFGVGDAPATPVAPVVEDEEEVTPEIKEAVAVAASIKSGEKVLVEASAFNSLKNQVEASAKIIAGYEKERIEASVDTHIARGAIKADQKDAWTKAIIASADNKNLLESLPDNKILASEIGHDDQDTTGEAGVAMETKIQEAIKASNGKLSYAQAAVQVATSDPDLANARQKELEAN